MRKCWFLCCNESSKHSAIVHKTYLLILKANATWILYFWSFRSSHNTVLSNINFSIVDRGVRTGNGHGICEYGQGRKGCMGKGSNEKLYFSWNSLKLYKTFPVKNQESILFFLSFYKRINNYILLVPYLPTLKLYTIYHLTIICRLLGVIWTSFALEPKLKLAAWTLVLRSGPKFFCLVVQFWK